MQLGIEQLVATLAEKFSGARIGVLCHAASVNVHGVHLLDLLANARGITLSAIFGPEHGVAGLAQDMEQVGLGVHPTFNVPVYSLYGDALASLKPAAGAVAQCDVIIIDLQDIGTRYYTYIYTMAMMLETCGATRTPVIVCDRPNPINGATIEGGLIEPGFTSFVGYHPLPVRHGMTIGELAHYFNAAYQYHAPLTVLPLQGWQRAQYWDACGMPWSNPSPNMRSLHAALLYPGMCLLEATNISEGRGTATPFEWCGAPWIDSGRLIEDLRTLQPDGIMLAPTTFTPQSRKFSGELCHGIHCNIVDREKFQSYRFGLALLVALAVQRGGDTPSTRFGWRTPHGNPPHAGLDAGPYEFVTDKPAIDQLTGSAHIRTWIDQSILHAKISAAIDLQSAEDTLQSLIGAPSPEFLQARTNSLLYR